MSKGDTRAATHEIGHGLKLLWKQRWIRIPLILLAIALIVRIALTALLAFAINRLAEPRDLECDWKSLELSLLTGRGEVRFLTVQPRGNAQGAEQSEPTPLVEIEYGVFDLEILQLLRGRLRLRRAEIDGLDTRLERGADGRWNIEQHVDIAEVLALLEPSEESEPEEEDEDDEGLDLTPPLAIEALRLQHARLRIVDSAIDPPLDVVLEANARLSNLDTSERPARFSVLLTGGELLDGATLEGEARWSRDALELDLSAQAGGLRPAQLSPYLDALDIRPAAESFEAGMSASVQLDVVGELRDAVQASVRLNQVHLITDGDEALALDELAIEVSEAGPRGVDIASIEVRGPRAAAALPTPDALRAAGFDFLAGRGGGGDATQAPAGWSSAVSSLFALTPPPALPPSAADVDSPPPAAPGWSLGRFEVYAGRVRLDDATVTPATRLELVLDIFELGAFSSLETPRRAIPFRGELVARGVAEEIVVAGELQPFGAERSLRIDVDATGIGLDEMSPYLERAGLQRTFQRGHLSTSIVAGSSTAPNGRTEAWIEVQETALEDSGELFGVQSISARDLVIDPNERLVRLGDIEIAGPRLAMRLDPSQGFAAFGLRTIGRASVAPSAAPAARVPKGSTPKGSTPPAETPRQDETQAEPDPQPSPGVDAPVAVAAGSTPVPLAPPRLELGRLAWVKSDVSFVDETNTPPRTLRVGEFGFELLDLTVGGDPDGPSPPPASFSARLVAQGIAEELTFSGTIESRPGPLDLAAHLELRGRGIAGGDLTPYLTGAGITPLLGAADVRLDVAAQLRETPSGLLAGLRLSGGELRDGDTQWLGLNELSVDELRLEAGGLRIAGVRLVAPSARIERDEQGRLILAGMRLDPPAAANVAPPTPGEPAPLELPSLPNIALDTFSLEQLRVELDDRLLEVAAALEVDLEASGLGTDGRTGNYSAKLRVPGALGELGAEGELSLDGAAASLKGRARARDWALGPFADLAPAALDLEADSSLECSFEALVAEAADGGLRAAVEVAGLHLASAAAPDAWLRWDSAHFEIERIDPVARRLALGPIHVRGAEVRARREADGTLRAASVRLLPPGAFREPAAPPQPQEDPTSAADSEAAQEKLDDGPATSDAAGTGGITRLPHTTLSAPLEFELARFEWTDAGLAPGTPPVAGSAVLALNGPVTVVNSNPADLPGLSGSIDVVLDGILEELHIDLHARPFAAQPKYSAELLGRGVRPQGIVERLPALAPMLRGNTEHGELSGSVAATLDVRRARPDSLGFSSPFAVDLQTSELAYRSAPNGPVLAGVDGIEMFAKRVDLRRARFHIESVDIATPRALLELSDAGKAASALGLTWSAPSADTESVSEAPNDVPPDPEPLPEPTPAEAQSETSDEPASFELRVDRVSVVGLDVEVRDDTITPPLHIPLVDLDAEFAGFSTRAWSTPRPMRFSGYLSAGVPDEGLDVPLFDEVAISGRFAPFPEPSGWAQLEMLGLELRPFSGISTPLGLELEDGAMTASTRVRLRGNDGAQLSASVEFTDLDLEEAEGGPLETSLALPVGLDTALFVLRTPDGQHSFSFGVGVDREGLSIAALALAATRTFAEVVAVAVASAPFQLLGALIPSSPPEDVIETFEFSAGTTELGRRGEARLRHLAERIETDPALRLVVRHELSAADLERADRLANPTSSECLELVRGLRARKRELWDRQRTLSSRAGALYAVGADEADEISRELARLEGELGHTEAALDRVLDVLRSNSPRQRERRRRTVVREMAELRLEAVRALLGSLFVRGSEERIDVRSPRAAVTEGVETGRVLVELRR